jgi:acetyl-CoA carboxylase carboxyl transferase subunit beta
VAWFKKTRKPIASSTAEKPSRVPEGLWAKCPGCAQLIYNKDLEQNQNVCPKCSHHFRIAAAERLRALFDDGRYDEHFPNLTSNDPLEFTDTKPYRDRLQQTIASSGLKDAIVVGTGRLDGLPVIVAAMEYSFIGGSMGVVVGEKITRAIEMAIDLRRPTIVISCSGGARMMEGALSLMPAPLSTASMTCGNATDAANKLPDNIACEVWPEPRRRTGSTSSPFFSKIFASLEIHGIHNVGDSVDTPQ